MTQLKKFAKNFADLKTQKIALICLLFSIVLLFIFNLSLFFLSQPRTLIATSFVQKKPIEKEDLVSFIQKNPSYIPGWLELAKILYEENDFEKAKFYFEKAKSINPNSEEVYKVQKEINL